MLWLLLLSLQVRLELFHIVGIDLVLLEVQPLCHQDILRYLRPNLVQISIIEHPMLREQHRLWEMLRLHIRWLFVQWHSDILINSCIFRGVICIIDLSFLAQVVHSIILFSYRYILHLADICPILNQGEDSVVEPRTSLQSCKLLFIESNVLMLWGDDYVLHILEDIFTQIVIPRVLRS